MDDDDFFFSDEFLANVEVPLSLNNNKEFKREDNKDNKGIHPVLVVQQKKKEVKKGIQPQNLTQNRPVVVVVQKKQIPKPNIPNVPNVQPQTVLTKKSPVVVVQNKNIHNNHNNNVNHNNVNINHINNNNNVNNIIKKQSQIIQKKTVIIVNPPPQQKTNPSSSSSIPIINKKSSVVVIPPIQKHQSHHSSSSSTIIPFNKHQSPQSSPTSTTSPSLNSPQSPNRNAIPDVLEFTLLSKDSFRVSKTGSRVAVSAFQMCRGVMDPKTEEWTFPLTEYNNLMANLSAIRSLRVKQLPQCVVNMFLKTAATPQALVDAAADSEMEKRVHPKIFRSLMDFQRAGVRFGISHGGRCMIADEMGLGKTIQALALVSCYKEEWPFLVVTPSSLKMQWAESIEEWLEIGAPDINVVNSGTKCDLTRGKAVVVSYDLVTRLKDKLAKAAFKVIVADESHMFKNKTSKRATVLVPVLKAAKRAILLSGTPALSRPSELYSQIDAINSSLFTNFHEFGLRYCGGYKSAFSWVFDGATNLGELNLILQSSVMIRRLKNDVLTQLPPKHREKINIGIVKEHTKILKGIMDELRDAIADSKSTIFDQMREGSNNKKRLVMELYRDTGAAKLPLVTAYIKDLLESDVKFLVFAHHQDVMDGIANVLRTNGVDHIRIDGRTPTIKRQEYAHHFQDDEGCRVALLSITAAGTGLNLTAANLIIFAELFWNPGVLRQAEDRCHRIGQKSDVTIRYLVAKNTVDEMIWTLIDRKLDVLGHALDGKDDKQEVTELEGRDDPENCIDSFIRDILDVVNTYEERRDSWKEAVEARKKARANPGALYPRDSLFDDDSDGYDIDGNGNGGGKRKRASKRANVSNNDNSDDSGGSDVEWNRSGDDDSNDGLEGYDDIKLPAKKMKASHRGGGSRRYSPKPIPVFVNGDARDAGDEELDRRSQLISPRKLGSFPRVAGPSAPPSAPTSRSGSASPMYQNNNNNNGINQPTSISDATKARLSARFEQFLNT